MSDSRPNTRPLTKFIKGINAEADVEWYTSHMLNRLMFVYFIQKKGFLDGDPDYQRNLMRVVRDAKAKDKFLFNYLHRLGKFQNATPPTPMQQLCR